MEKDKNVMQSNRLKYQLQHEMKNLIYLMDGTLYQMLEIIWKLFQKTWREG